MDPLPAPGRPEYRTHRAGAVDPARTSCRSEALPGTGGPELAERLEAEGYDWVKEELGIEDETVGQKA